jgi:hypothetical protein
MSRIGVDARTYALMHSRTYADCLDRCRGDTSEAKSLAAYYMRDWYVIDDGPTQAELSEPDRERHW